MIEREREKEGCENAKEEEEEEEEGSIGWA